MNWSAGARPYWKKTNPAKAAARSIQNPVQAIAALKPITGERRWSPRSRANMAKTKRLNPIQNARECAIRLVQQFTGRKRNRVTSTPAPATRALAGDPVIGLSDHRVK